jgi:hypothetical protein
MRDSGGAARYVVNRWSTRLGGWARQVIGPERSYSERRAISGSVGAALNAGTPVAPSAQVSSVQVGGPCPLDPLHFGIREDYLRVSSRSTSFTITPTLSTAETSWSLVHPKRLHQYRTS